MSEVLDSAQATPLRFPASPEKPEYLHASSSSTSSSDNDNFVSLDSDKRMNLDAGPSSQQLSKVYKTTTEAIANFKPTPRQVISGIAPHVFDERKRRRSQSPRRAPKPYWYGNEEKRSSPLRGATVISWDEHSIYLEQPPDHKRSASFEILSNELPSVNHPREPDYTGQPDRQPRSIINNRHVKSGKAGWKYFRVDIHLLKTIVVKLKLTSSPKPRKPTQS